MANAVLSILFVIIGVILLGVTRDDRCRHWRYPIGAIASFVLVVWGIVSFL